MKLKLFYGIIMFAMLSCSGGNGLSESSIIGTWSRPIDTGMTVTTTDEKGETSQVKTGPVSDEIMIFNPDMTFTMKETPRSGNADFYVSHGTWKISEDNKAVEIFIEGQASTLVILKINDTRFVTEATNGNEIVFEKI
jgi:hypothetical protein